MGINPLYLLPLLVLLPLLWWLTRRRATATRVDATEERLDTLAAWPPEPTRILRTTERLAYSTLKLALPGYMILAQVPISRFLTVPKRFSYAEWMRRLGGQCVDFVVCDVTSQVVAVVDIRPPVDQISERLRVRLSRVERTLEAAQIPMHIWTEDALPSVDAARARILPDSPAVPPRALRRSRDAGSTPGIGGVGLGTATGIAGMTIPAAEMVSHNPFDDNDNDWSGAEVIEVSEPSSSTWFDELDSVSAALPTPEVSASR